MKKSIRILVLSLALIGLTFISSCALPRVSAQQRTFLDISLEFLGEYQLPKMKFQDTTVGGLSGITYDRQRDRFYAISDDRSNLAPARFYTLNLDLNNSKLQNVNIENVTFLKTKDRETYPKGSIDPEGIALTPQGTVFISSEGVTHELIPPFIGEFDLKNGRLKQNLPLPQRYIPDAKGEQQQRGIQDNLGFESLTLNPIGSLPSTGEPIRLFTVTESALIQDKDPPQKDEQGNYKPQIIKCRFLHYLISDGPPIIISEHLYPLSPNPPGAIYHGVVDLLAIDQGGHFLSLERSFGLTGFGAKVYQVFTGAATDTSRIASLKGEIRAVQPVKKQLVLDLQELKIRLDNLEGLTFGPRLPDGSQSLILVSDDNFKKEQITQFLLFRLKRS
ncbi:esterase-like activity of phytase family protein [Phormidium sp. LEGE 05292]|uniref:esterase-like activity of phytase family protein n=1 Tax=[Phormidium] sp. LEGE 05292 TaxID=767427 RepID=UPI00187DE9D9|nr:esterase-like activity of phytase family protein [Phormidium sp. LEGE 05292]MBE9226037.1 esterase-like activity of phytase family protein [Phormidium sp. LEGE 05292]